MKSPIITKENTQVDIADEVMGFAFSLVKVFGALFGLWAVACVVAGLISFGPLQMLRGYITAITGF